MRALAHTREALVKRSAAEAQRARTEARDAVVAYARSWRAAELGHASGVRTADELLDLLRRAVDALEREAQRAD